MMKYFVKFNFIGYFIDYLKINLMFVNNSNFKIMGIDFEITNLYCYFD
jgi:hypothetical protein